MSADTPLLPTKSPVLDDKSTGFSSSRDSPTLASQFERVLPKRKTARLVAGVLGTLIVGYLVLSSLSGSHRRRAQRAARGRQHLDGFSESRRASVPEGLRSKYDLPIGDLLGHPLLTAHSTPVCRLNSFAQNRYAPLLPSYRRRSKQPHDLPRSSLTYFVALNLYDSASVAPSLIRALHAVLSSLGPSRFHVSIYENGSHDDTPLQLFLLAKLLRQIGAGYTIVSDPNLRSGFKEGKRIEGLAALRNRAMQPLYDAPAGTWDRVVFINDVHLCEAELLEVLLQHEVQDADMSCGMDFKELQIPEFEGNYPLLFYDSWVARDFLGLPFYNIKYPKGDWVLPSPIMPLSPSRFRYDSLLPTQVYSCWNGITVLRASLFHAPHSIRFRTHEGTDMHSECYLLCSDIWRALSPTRIDGSANLHPLARGARIQIVPRAAVGYRVEEYDKARQDRNTTAFELEGEEKDEARRAEMVEWEKWPPRLVQTYPYGHWDQQISIPPF
ncbi:hypothetical protein JCM10207_003523 [Rhodosporidiobolus poonsookiae]